MLCPQANKNNEDDVMPILTTFLDDHTLDFAIMRG